MTPQEMKQLAELLQNVPGISSIELKDVKGLAQLLRESPEIGSIEVQGLVRHRGRDHPDLAPIGHVTPQAVAGARAVAGVPEAEPREAPPRPPRRRRRSRRSSRRWWGPTTRRRSRGPIPM